MEALSKNAHTTQLAPTTVSDIIQRELHDFVYFPNAYLKYIPKVILV